MFRSLEDRRYYFSASCCICCIKLMGGGTACMLKSDLSTEPVEYAYRNGIYVAVSRLKPFGTHLALYSSGNGRSLDSRQRDYRPPARSYAAAHFPCPPEDLIDASPPNSSNKSLLPTSALIPDFASLALGFCSSPLSSSSFCGLGSLGGR
jgi:hypothetical protein